MKRQETLQSSPKQVHCLCLTSAPAEDTIYAISLTQRTSFLYRSVQSVSWLQTLQQLMIHSFIRSIVHAFNKQFCMHLRS